MPAAKKRRATKSRRKCPRGKKGVKPAYRRNSRRVKRRGHCRRVQRTRRAARTKTSRKRRRRRSASRRRRVTFRAQGRRVSFMARRQRKPRRGSIRRLARRTTTKTKTKTPYPGQSPVAIQALAARMTAQDAKDRGLRFRVGTPGTTRRIRETRARLLKMTPRELGAILAAFG